MWPSIFRRRVFMFFTSIIPHSIFIPHSVLRLAVTAIVTVVPPTGTRMSEAARAHADSNCRSAVLSVAAPNNAGLEVSNPDAKDSANPATAGSSALDVPPATLPIDWYFGPAPRRFVALVDVTSARRLMKLRVSVLLRSGVCQLTAWQIVSVAPGSQPARNTTTPSPAKTTPATTTPSPAKTTPATTGRAPSTTLVACAKDGKKSPSATLACS